MNGDRRSAGHRIREEQPRETAVVGGDDRGGKLFAGGVGREKVVRVERARIDWAGEEDLRAEGDAHFVGSVLGRDGLDAERDQFGERDVEGLCDRVAGSVAGVDVEFVRTDGESRQVERFAELAGRAVEDDRSRGLDGIEAVAERDDVGAGAVGEAGEDLVGGEFGSVGQVVERDRRCARVEREVEVGCRFVAGNVSGGEGQGCRCRRRCRWWRGWG